MKTTNISELLKYTKSRLVMAETCLNIIFNKKHENQDMDTKYAKQKIDYTKM
jgi:hypothetical protein